MTKYDFLDRADAGRQMFEKFGNKVLSSDLIVVVQPAAREIAFEFASETTIPMRDLVISRTAAGVVIPRITAVLDLRVAVIDDGVETGTTAMAIGAMLKTEGAAVATLMVPICPRSVLPQLLQVYDAVDFVVSPLAPQSLTLHYEVN
jgi:predicted phosphoribosyltransferase